MYTIVIGARNAIIHFLYTRILKPIFFLRDPEDVHDRMVKFGSKLGSRGATRRVVRGFFHYSHDMLEQTIRGLSFPNPVGLAAGFDKNAELIQVLPEVGFGFVEVGSITGKACAGNPRPRLWRLKKSKGLVVYYGLKNDGADVVSERIAKTLAKNPAKIPVGTSVAMTNCAENVNVRKAVEDYARAFHALAHIGDYNTVNISCPNAQGGQPFMAPHNLDALFETLDAIPTEKPIFVKVSPDMSESETDELLRILKKHRVHGIITGNLTKKKDNPHIHDSLPSVGGVSGKPVQHLSDALIEYIYRKEGDRFVIVGCGGIFNAEDAYKKIRKGASLVQMVTGMIFEGPQVVGEINRGLAKLLKHDGFKSVSDAIGIDARG